MGKQNNYQRLLVLPPRSSKFPQILFFDLAYELTFHLKISILSSSNWNHLSSTLPLSSSKSPYTNLNALIIDWYQYNYHLYFQIIWYVIAMTFYPLYEIVRNLCKLHGILSVFLLFNFKISSVDAFSRLIFLHPRRLRVFLPFLLYPHG